MALSLTLYPVAPQALKVKIPFPLCLLMIQNRAVRQFRPVGPDLAPGLAHLLAQQVETVRLIAVLEKVYSR